MKVVERNKDGPLLLFQEPSSVPDFKLIHNSSIDDHDINTFNYKSSVFIRKYIFKHLYIYLMNIMPNERVTLSCNCTSWSSKLFTLLQMSVLVTIYSCSSSYHVTSKFQDMFSKCWNGLIRLQFERFQFWKVMLHAIIIVL